MLIRSNPPTVRKPITPTRNQEVPPSKEPEGCESTWWVWPAIEGASMSILTGGTIQDASALSGAIGGIKGAITGKDDKPGVESVNEAVEGAVGGATHGVVSNLIGQTIGSAVIFGATMALGGTPVLGLLATAAMGALSSVASSAVVESIQEDHKKGDHKDSDITSS